MHHNYEYSKQFKDYNLSSQSTSTSNFHMLYVFPEGAASSRSSKYDF